MIFQPTFVMSSTITRAAYSFAVRAASAVLFVGMSVWAMGSATLDLSKIATPNVFLLCDGLQVSRVDAAAHAAQVVELQFGRDGSPVLFVVEFVRPCRDCKLLYVAVSLF